MPKSGQSRHCQDQGMLPLPCPSTQSIGDQVQDGGSQKVLFVRLAPEPLDEYFSNVCMLDSHPLRAIVREKREGHL